MKITWSDVVGERKMPSSTIRVALRNERVAHIDEADSSWEGGNIWPPAYQIVESLNSELHPIIGAEALEAASLDNYKQNLVCRCVCEGPLRPRHSIITSKILFADVF